MTTDTTEGRRWYVIDDVEVLLTPEEYRSHRDSLRAFRARQRWFDGSNIDERWRYRRTSDLTWPPEQEHAAATYARDFVAGKISGRDWATSGIGGLGLLLTGPSGAGKTTLATRLCRDILDNAPTDTLAPFAQGRRRDRLTHRAAVRPVYFTRMDELVDVHKALMSRSPEEDDLEESVNEFRQIVLGITGIAPRYAISLLVIDDAGKEYQTDYTHSIFENVVRRRFSRGLATIVTSNIALEDWLRVYGPSVASFALEAFLAVPIIYTRGDKSVDRRTE